MKNDLDLQTLYTEVQTMQQQIHTVRELVELLVGAIHHDRAQLEALSTLLSEGEMPDEC